MEKIKIITDSTADLPKDVCRKYDIEVLPLVINFGEDSYLDGVEITPKEIFEKIDNGSVMPTTAQVIPSRFEKAYKKYLDEGYKIISIHISSDMSGTYNSACIAKSMLESDDIKVIDSRVVTLALGALVYKAAILKEKGKSFNEIVNELEIAKEKLVVSTCFQSLDYLIKGGRISKTAGIIGNVLGIKLIVNIQDGMMGVKDKVRGNKKATKKILQELENVKLDKDVPIFLIEAGNKEIQDVLIKNLEDEHIPFIESPIGSTVSIHAGPNVAGIAFLME